VTIKFFFFLIKTHYWFVLGFEESMKIWRNNKYVTTRVVSAKRGFLESVKIWRDNKLMTHRLFWRMTHRLMTQRLMMHRLSLWLFQAKRAEQKQLFVHRKTNFTEKSDFKSTWFPFLSLKKYQRRLGLPKKKLFF